MSLPTVSLTGNAVADASLRFTSSGIAVASVRVACSSRKKVGDQWEDGDTTFLDVSAWRQLAENMAESVTKGTTITVTGELKQRRWETPEGEKRSAYEVSARSVALDLSRATGSVNTASRNQTDGRDPWAKGDGHYDLPF